MLDADGFFSGPYSMRYETTPCSGLGVHVTSAVSPFKLIILRSLTGPGHEASIMIEAMLNFAASVKS